MAISSLSNPQRHLAAHHCDSLAPSDVLGRRGRRKSNGGWSRTDLQRIPLDGLWNSLGARVGLLALLILTLEAPADF